MYIQAHVSRAAFAFCFSELVSNAVLSKQYSIQDECIRFHLLVIRMGENSFTITNIVGKTHPMSNLQITSLTKKTILRILREGFTPLGSTEVLKMNIFGELSELDFFDSLYDLKSLPSYDSRFKNAYADFYQHRIEFQDWEEDWFIDDDRLELQKNDEHFLKFLSHIFHPEVRKESGPWKQFLEEINGLLKPDGYQLVPIGQISGRDIYAGHLLEHIKIKRGKNTSIVDLKVIGDGSYATVYAFKDEFLDIALALKRLKKNSSQKEIERFFVEYDVMHSLDSPYVLKVYTCNRERYEYVMELMDDTLNEYIERQGNTLPLSVRADIIRQVINGVRYIHSKGLLHRDIGPKNILIKHYDDGTIQVKLSDFGLVKVPDSNLTTLDSEVKGSMHDPDLIKEGYHNYNQSNELFSLTWLILYILTGRPHYHNIQDIEYQKLKKKGLGDKSMRYNSLEELVTDVEECISSLQSRQSTD